MSYFASFYINVRVAECESAYTFNDFEEMSLKHHALGKMSNTRGKIALGSGIFFWQSNHLILGDECYGDDDIIETNVCDFIASHKCFLDAFKDRSGVDVVFCVNIFNYPDVLINGFFISLLVLNAILDVGGEIEFTNKNFENLDSLQRYIDSLAIFSKCNLQ